MTLNETATVGTSVEYLQRARPTAAVLESQAEPGEAATDVMSRQGYDVPVSNHAVFRKAFSEEDAKYHAVHEYAFSVFHAVEDSA